MAPFQNALKLSVEFHNSGRFKGGGAVGTAAPYWLIFFQKGAFFRVKGIQSVVCICDK